MPAYLERCAGVGDGGAALGRFARLARQGTAISGLAVEPGCAKGSMTEQIFVAANG
jgi:hypothetical protein